MAARSGEPKLTFSGLGRILRSPYADRSRIRWFASSVGTMLLMHVWGKFNAGAARIAAAFGNNYGLPMPDLFAYAAMFMETDRRHLHHHRAVHALLRGGDSRSKYGIALIVAHLPKGSSVGSQGGYEYVLLLGIVLLAIAMRGGGPYSVDARSAKNSKNQTRDAKRARAQAPRALRIQTLLSCTAAPP